MSDATESGSDEAGSTLNPGDEVHDPNGIDRASAFCVVAIGASAGGIEAISELLAQLPPQTTPAFVVVMHMPRDIETHAHEIFQKFTKIPVRLAQDGASLEPERIYVVPPNAFATIEQGRFRLDGVVEPDSRKAPIDRFFRSVAADLGERAIGIVLSGAGSDGTLGIKAIEAAGGMTIVQEPHTAIHDGMPRSALRTGIVDYVLPVESMPAVILGYSAHPYVKQPATLPELAEVPRESIDTVISILQAQAGYYFGAYKKSTVARRVLRRMGLGQVGSLTAYIELLRTNPAEVHELYRDLLIVVTDFFRDPEAWEELRQQVIAPIVASIEPGRPIRVWVPGCATGEEAYTIAILILEEMRSTQRPAQLQIFASDLNAEALEIARVGIYPLSISEDVPPLLLRHYFTEVKGDHHYQVNALVRESVVFAKQNLISDPPFSRLDLISCRNVLIYLEQDVQKQVMSLFHFALLEGRFLFLGSAETPTQSSELFLPISRRLRIYRRAEMIRRGQGSLSLRRGKEDEATQMGVKVGTTMAEHRFTRLAQQFVLEHFAPASVLINSSFSSLYFTGQVRDFLIQPTGAPTQDLLALVRQGLRTKLRTAVQQAVRSGQRVIASGVRMQRNESSHAVRITVYPIRGVRLPEDLFLIVFENDEGIPALPDKVEGHTIDFAEQGLVRQLEYDLKVTREDLQNIIEELEVANEELKASNEEVMSINEELQSRNEELETSKEELQSLNEELSTVNSQLEVKVSELEEANNDLGNLLSSTDIAVLFLDTRHCIKRFTAPVTKLLNMLPSDIGRPLEDFAPKFTDTHLVRDISQVLARLIPVDAEVQTHDGEWLLRRVLPYRTDDNRIDGVVITFTDITRVKEVEVALADSEERYRLTVESAREYAIFLIDAGGNIATWNSGAERLLGFSAVEAVGKSTAIIFTPEDRSSGEHEKELANARENGCAEDERWHLRKDGSRFWASGIVSAMYDTDGGLRAFSKVMRDHSERRRMEKQLIELNDQLEQRVHERTAETEQLVQRLRQLGVELLIAEDRERGRIAADLHDDLGQMLALTRLRTSELRRSLEGRAEASLALEINQLLESAVASVRSLTFQLSPPMLTELGLAPTLDWLADEMRRMYGLEVVVVYDDVLPALEERINFTMYRAVRELLINVVKHAGVPSAVVTLQTDAHQVVVTVEDSGAGLDVDAIQSGGGAIGYGIFSIRERMQYLGGNLSLESKPGEGTRVTVCAPINEQPTGAAGGEES